jgi:hypothetical protein
MSKLTRKPTTQQASNIETRYEFANLKDNPFPVQPMVEIHSSDPRINGNIYEFEIRKPEHNKIVENFLKVSKTSPNHLRLGYLIDTSYIGRGNGKSAFLIKLNEQVNNEYCLDISENVNKCFSAYVSPPPGGRCKTYPLLVDSMFKAILDSDIIESTLATLRLSALEKKYPDIYKNLLGNDSEIIVHNLNTPEWFKENEIEVNLINKNVCEMELINSLPSHFPLLKHRGSFLQKLITKEDFKEYYTQNIRKPAEKLQFFFDDLVCFFEAADFNGAYLLIDNFENIPDFQSARQRKDFALELRNSIFDGFFRNSRQGFYSMILVLHAGVESLISDSWSESGLDNRSPIMPGTDSKHIIPFEKLGKEHAVLLIRKYLEAYRIKNDDIDPLAPFTDSAIEYIGQASEFNASRMLKTAYELIEIAASNKTKCIDKEFVTTQKTSHSVDPDKGMPTIDEAHSEDLSQKIQGNS